MELRLVVLSLLRVTCRRLALTLASIPLSLLPFLCPQFTPSRLHLMLLLVHLMMLQRPRPPSLTFLLPSWNLQLQFPPHLCHRQPQRLRPTTPTASITTTSMSPTTPTASMMTPAALRTHPRRSTPIHSVLPSWLGGSPSSHNGGSLMMPLSSTRFR